MSDTRLWLRQKERDMTCISAARGRFLVEFLKVSAFQCRRRQAFSSETYGKKPRDCAASVLNRGRRNVPSVRAPDRGLWTRAWKWKRMLDREAMPTMKRISGPGVTLRIVKKIPALALGIGTTLPPGSV